MKISGAALIARFAPDSGCFLDSTYTRIKPCEKQFCSSYCLTILLSSIFDSSEKPALMKAIENLQQSTQKAKCTLWVCLQSKFYLYVHTL